MGLWYVTDPGIVREMGQSEYDQNKLYVYMKFSND